MNGTIKTFLPEKGYGFIKGDDSKDYFFHKSHLSNLNDVRHIIEEVSVSFEQAVTPKGYQAKNIKIIKSGTITTYIRPEKFLYSKSSSVKGWDTIETGGWIIVGESSESPDKAKEIVLRRARDLGANGMVDLEYFKTRGSKPGTGRGIYYFTIHNYRGRPVILAKKNASGKLKRESLIGLNRRLSDEKIRLHSLTVESKNQARKKWRNLFLFSLLFGIIYFPAFFMLMFLGIFLIKPENYDSWLIK